MFEFSDTNKRYHTFSYELKNRFNKKIMKISLDSGLSCPNIDGTKGYGGCTFCGGNGSGNFIANRELSIENQLEKAIEQMQHKWSSASYIAYFQAHTNTYASVEKLKRIFEIPLRFNEIVGLDIATRPDCINTEIVEYLEQLSKRTYLIVELGLQTIFDETAKNINRCYEFNDFLIAYEKLKQKNINVCVHIINGLPNETANMMLCTAKEIAILNPHSIKIHLLHILKDTKMAQQYKNKEFLSLELDEYVNIVCNQLEVFNPNVIIQRITGDGDKSTLIAPLWSTNKLNVMNSIDKELVRRNSWQGKFAVK